MTIAIRDVLRFAALLVACGALSAAGQRLVVLPASEPSSSLVTTYSTQPFAPASEIHAAPGAFLAFTNPAGSRLLLVTTTGVVVVDPSGAELRAPLAVRPPVTSAALSPDGRRLVVISGDSSSGMTSIFDVSGHTAFLVATLAVANHPTDVAISLDSARAYVVGAAGLTPIDLTANAAGRTVGLDGLVSDDTAKPAVAVGPNGLVYVSARRAVYEIHPATLAVLNTIAVSGFPGRLSFTNDATAAVAVNQLPGDPAATVLNLAEHSVTSTLTALAVRLDRAFFAGANMIYATSPASHCLYEFAADSPNDSLRVAAYNVVSATTSNEPASPRHLFTIGPGGVTRTGLNAPSTAAAVASLTTQPGAALYLAPASEGTPASVVQHNRMQTLAAGAISLPLVVQLLDAGGRPASNQLVDWAPAAGVTLRQAMTATNAQGIATATAIAPASAGKYSVAVSVRDAPVGRSDFSVEVDTPGTTVGLISMVSGNGQVVRSGVTTLEPLVAAVADAGGNPLAGVPVTFVIGSGGGTLAVNTNDASQSKCPASGATLICNTDSTGLASVLFQGGGPAVGYSQSTVTASAPSGGSIVFNVTTVPVVPVVSTLGLGGPAQITGQTGQILKGALQVQVLGPTSNGVLPLSNVGLSVRPTASYVLGSPSPAVCAGGTVLTDGAGLASCDLVLGNQPGTYSLYRVVGGYAVGPWTLTITPAPTVATTIQAIGDGQSGAVGQPLPASLVGIVKDQFGNPMANVSVAWTVLSGNATLTTQGTMTDAQGRASANVTLGATPGPVEIQMAVGTATAIFQLLATEGISSIVKVAGDGQSAAINTAFLPLTVQLNGAQGPAAGVPVTFDVVSGSAALAADPSVATNAQGQASIGVSAGSDIGPVVVTASGGGQTVAFQLAVGPPGLQLSLSSFTNGASAQSGFSLGSIVVITAAGLTDGLSVAPGTCLSGGVVAEQLPTRLAGVEFQFGNLLAPIFAICRKPDGTEQATVQAPFELAPEKTSVTVRYRAGTAQPAEFTISGVPVLNAAPGIFESSKMAVATKTDGSVVSPANPAHPGETIRMKATGLGPVLPHVSTNHPGFPGQTPFFKPVVSLGGTNLSGVMAEYAENTIGMFVVTFQIPADSPLGAAVPLTIGVLTGDKTPATSQTSQVAISN